MSADGISNRLVSQINVHSLSTIENILNAWNRAITKIDKKRARGGDKNGQNHPLINTKLV